MNIFGIQSLLLSMALLTVACPDSQTKPATKDSGPADAPLFDVGSSDVAGRHDAAVVVDGAVDGWAAPDHIAPHDGALDTGNSDGTITDIGFGDSAPPDSAAPDSAAPDSAPPDSVQGIDGTAADVVVPPDATGLDSMTADVPSSGTIVVELTDPSDAVTSYLIDGNTGSWNSFYGDTVHLGRHWDLDRVSYHTALRFTGLAIPQAAVIDSVVLTFFPTNEVDSQHNLWINIYAEVAANSAPFNPQNHTSGRPDQRLRSSAHIDHWLVRCNDDCTDITEWDCPQRKLDCWDRSVAFSCPKDLKSLLQEVVDLADWRAGNAFTLLLLNAATDQDGADYQDSRALTGYDPQRGQQYSARLQVTYH